MFDCRLSWHVMVFDFALESLAPSWYCDFFCIMFLEHMLGGSCMGGIFTQQLVTLLNVVVIVKELVGSLTTFTSHFVVY